MGKKRNAAAMKGEDNLDSGLRRNDNDSPPANLSRCHAGLDPASRTVESKTGSRIDLVCMADIPSMTEAEQIKADGGYRRGFSHGVQTVADLLWERMNEPTRKGIERIQEIVLRLRFDGKVHSAFSDDLRRKLAPGNGKGIDPGERILFPTPVFGGIMRVAGKK